MSEYGRVHKLIVSDVGEPYEANSTHEFADYEIEHPDECKLVTRVTRASDDTIVNEYEEYECEVTWNIDQAGCRWLLHYSGARITEPGEYLIQAWAETIKGFDFTEYDGGIKLVEPESPASEN